MPPDTNDNDIYGLLLRLTGPQHSRHYAALTALVAERNALREQLRLANIDQFNTEAESNDRDRELRERLVCAALTALCADPRYEVADADRVVAIADAALAAMRKETSDGK